ncbi:PREDICTED: uncharacterized protein LOC104599957 [Nelumbo nucifera]|uniref:Uncharacterized protein LOC104599957 n=1 Tax=Nelumbo nucifera TaxID=4432 RepID=A0A1U8A1X9_NELNU|nr:PREDICTED: uncharacterized protein LOC104599957 [Nelumbo nucifera]
MLLAVEGGGFFSSSASGYSKGLTLLLLGQKNEERPMRVSPWNQYQLVEQEADTDFQLASQKNQVSCGCASFVCFRRPSAGIDSPYPLKVGPAQQQDVLSVPHAVSGKDEDCITYHVEDKNTTKVYLKSSLKKPSNCAMVPSGEHATLGETDKEVPGCTERRKVQWTDTCGKELVEIREFELSDVASDEELEGENERNCSCVIM